jgi:hypothetical protein
MLMHNRLGTAIANALKKRTDVVIGMVPMHLPDPLGSGSRKSDGP